MSLSKDPLVAEWKAQLHKRGGNTERQYLGLFSRCFETQVRGYTPKAWVEEVKNQQKSAEIKERRAWGKLVEDFLTSYRIPETGLPYALKTKKAIVSAVRSFLELHVGELAKYSFTLATSEETVAEMKRKEEIAQGISIDEYTRLVHEAKPLRDKAVLLSLASGLGTGEWAQFSQEWHRYADAIRNSQVPIRVSVIRPKTKVAYRVCLWDDAVDYLRLLLEERERQTGRRLGKSDPLFSTVKSVIGGGKTGQIVPMTEQRVQHMVRELADRTGLDPRVPG